MNQEIAEMLEKAERSNKAAEKMFDEGFYDFSVSRAYYTMLYAAEALLLTKDLAFSKHSAVISAFGQHFVKTAQLPAELHASFRKAFDKRAKGDYSLEKVNSAEAEEIIAEAKDFVSNIKQFISQSQL